jgi:hypothetical protein
LDCCSCFRLRHMLHRLMNNLRAKTRLMFEGLLRSNLCEVGLILVGGRKTECPKKWISRVSIPEVAITPQLPIGSIGEPSHAGLFSLALIRWRSFASAPFWIWRTRSPVSAPRIRNRPCCRWQKWHYLTKRGREMESDGRIPLPGIGSDRPDRMTRMGWSTWPWVTGNLRNELSVRRPQRSQRWADDSSVER